MDVTMAYLGLTVIAPRRTQGALCELVDLAVRLSGAWMLRSLPSASTVANRPA